MDRFGVTPELVQQAAEQHPRGRIIGRQRSCVAQQRLRIAEPLLVLDIDVREAAHGVDIVRALAQGAAQRLDRLGLPARAHVIERGRDPALVGILLEELLECRIRLEAAAQRSECLAELAVHERQARLQANGLAEARLRLREALLHREDAAEILVQVREIRLERDRLAHDLLRFRRSAPVS